MKAVIFDLDGTLINSLTDIALSMNNALKEFGFKEHKIDKYKYFIGGGSYILTMNSLPVEVKDEEVAKVYFRFLENYESCSYKNTNPYDGIYYLLTKLSQTDLKLGVLSNKPHELTKQFVSRYFNDYDFQEIHGQKEGVPPKPNPTAALDITKNFDVQPEEIFYIGDTCIDIETAKNSNMKSIGVSWGFRTKEELEKLGADYVVDNPLELWKILNPVQNNH